MLVRTPPIRLPRRITAYFLLFGIAALLWVSATAVYVARSVSDSRSESATLRALGRGCERIALAHLRNKNADLQPLLAEIRSQSNAEYCAIADPTGVYVYHTNPALMGKPVIERGEIQDRWGDILRVRYVHDDGVLVYEYCSPLKAAGTVLGTLRLGINQQTVWSYLRSAARFAPLAFLGPGCCIAVGAVLLNRMVRPVADIEHQLFQVANSASLESCQLREVECVGAAAHGWNRLVGQRLRSAPGESLEHRIRHSLVSNRYSRLDAVLNSLPDGVATTDGEGRITYINLPMATLLGLKNTVSTGNITGHSTDAPIMTEQLVQRWHLSRTDPLFCEENRERPVVTELMREENGERRIARIARHPICIVGAAKFETHVWTMRDVTQQKLAEEMRDQFVDTATHELRTPLANIKAYAETLALADVIDIEQQKQFLNTINAEATRLARFVDDLLSVSSMELGSLSLNKQVIDLGRLLNEVLGKVRPQIEEKRQTLEVVLPEKLPEPEMDKDKIATVLVNLLGNAVKYTPPGGRITFRANVTDRHIEISVEDSGVGIAEDELPKVFDKFFRSRDPRVQEQTGTGLGLALAQEVVRLHGGRITVESQIDKGSTFSVFLPLG